MSPIKYAAIICFAVGAVSVKLVIAACELATGQTIIPTNLNALFTIAAVISWGGVFTAAILNRMDALYERVVTVNLEAVEKAGEHAATDARLDMLTKQKAAVLNGPRRPTLVEG